jgi:hypothetical protein
VELSFSNLGGMHRIFGTPVAEVYAHYVAKVERKGASLADMRSAITWLTGFDGPAIDRHLAEQTTFRDFFDSAQIHPDAIFITGRICGVVIQDIEDPLMKKIRYLDKIVDEVASGRPLAKVLRAQIS